MVYYNYIKALHLIFVITWFAGLFYIPRLFMYHIKANKKSTVERDILVPQFKIMSWRLWYIITWPSAVLATFFAIWLLYLMPSYLGQSWMLMKLIFVALLIVYHLKTHQIFLQLQEDKIRYSSNFMRFWNEGATIILFAVVFLVILRDAVNWIYGLVGLFVLAFLLFLGIKIYKSLRKS